MRAKGLRPRVLADDVTVIAEGEGAIDKLRDGFDATLKFFHDMGARASQSKSDRFASKRTDRQLLRNIK